MHYFSTLFR